jgi:hypothetical protein
MRLPAAVLLLVATAGPLCAQAAAPAPDTAAVLAPVHRLFDAMRAGDAAAARAVFHPDATLAGAEMKDGQRVFQVMPASEFVEAIGRPHEKQWDERVRDPVVQVDGDLATAWMPYSFYLGGAFSHCGVDSFELFRGEQGWLITRIADTRRREGCAGAPAAGR